MNLATVAYYTFILFPAFYLGLTLTFFTLSSLSISLPQSSFYARVLSAYATLIFCASYGVLASIILRLAGDGNISQWATARAFKYTMALTTGVRFEVVSGAEHLKTRPCVIIGNHQSALDVLLLGEIFPKYCAVTAKRSLKAVPFLGWYMALSGTVFIDRADRASAIRAFDGAAETMRKEKQSVFIFPEGTRSNARGPELGQFKKGAFHLAVRGGVDIVPVVCANYWGVLSLKERRFRAGRIAVKVLPPIPTAHLTAADVDNLTTSTRELMLRELTALTASPLGQKATRAEPSTPEEENSARLATGVELR